MLGSSKCHILLKDIPSKQTNICLSPKLNKLEFRDTSREFEWDCMALLNARPFRNFPRCSGYKLCVQIPHAFNLNRSQLASDI